MIKYCGGCKAEKPIGEFYKHAASKDGLQHRCKECCKSHVRKWSAENKDRVKAKDKATKLKHRFSVSLRKARYVAKKEGHLPCLATAEWIESKFDGFCTLCGTPEIECNYKLCMDHDRETGIFRGWICGRCNKALGLFKDSKEVLMKAALYLENNEISKG